MSIRDELEAYDGKHTDVLEGILSRHRSTNSFVGSLVPLVAEEDQKLQTAATRRLNTLAENDVQFRLEHLLALFGSLSELTHWISKLHVCQMLQYVAIPDESARNVVWFLERNLWDENGFLRAWSYNGFYELASQHRKYIPYAMEQLDRGEADQAGSVRARIRNIRKALNKKVP